MKGMPGSGGFAGLKLVVLVAVGLFLATAIAAQSLMRESAKEDPSAGTVSAAASALDTRPIRMLTQSDFVYNIPGSRKYVTSVGVSPAPSYATIATGNAYTTNLSLADWNRDGRDDLFDMTGNTFSVTLSASSASNLGAAGTKYQIAPFSTRYWTILGSAAGDWSGDGYSDAFVIARSVSAGTYYVHYYKGTGAAADGQVYYLKSGSSDQFMYIASGDFNADGRADLALAVKSGSSYLLQIVLSLSTSSNLLASVFPAYQATLASKPIGIAMGDWDSDGYSDAIVATDDLKFSIALGRPGVPSPGTGLTLLSSPYTATIKPRFVAAGDWNADGKDDLFTAYPVTTQNWEVKVVYSGSTGSGKIETGGSATFTLTYVFQVYAFGVGGWSDDNTYAQHNGLVGTREIPVPVALLIPPPWLTSVANVPYGDAFYGTSVTDTYSHSDYSEISAGAGLSVGAEVKVCVLVCAAGIEAKVEVGLSASVTRETGAEETMVTQMKYDVRADGFFNPSAGKYEPLVLVDNIAYDDYEFVIANAKAPTGFRVNSFTIDLPVSSRTYLSTWFLSNWNSGKPKDMPTFATNRVGGDIFTYLQDDPPYTNGWQGPGAYSQWSGSGETTLALKEGSFSGFKQDDRFNYRGEVTAMAGGITGGFYGTASLAKGYTARYYHGTELLIGGRAPKLSLYETDPGVAGQYETYGYNYNAWVYRQDYTTGGIWPFVSTYVLDWKVTNLHDGYPAGITSTSAQQTTATVNWRSAGGNDLRSGYYVQWSTSSTFSSYYTSALLASVAVGYQASSLAQSTVYYFRVQAVFTSGWRTYSNVVTITTLASSYSLTISAGSGGTTSPAPGTYTYATGSVVSVLAQASSNYAFDHWVLDSTSYTANPILVTMNGNRQLTAVFRYAGTYTLTITSSSYGTTSPAPGTYSYVAGTRVTVTPIPSGICDYFYAWTLDGVSYTNDPITVTMDGNHNLAATFKHLSPKYCQLLVVGTPSAGTDAMAPALGAGVDAPSSRIWPDGQAASGIPARDGLLPRGRLEAGVPQA